MYIKLFEEFSFDDYHLHEISNLKEVDKLMKKHPESFKDCKWGFCSDKHSFNNRENLLNSYITRYGKFNILIGKDDVYGFFLKDGKIKEGLDKSNRHANDRIYKILDENGYG